MIDRDGVRYYKGQTVSFVYAGEKVTGTISRIFNRQQKVVVRVPFYFSERGIKNARDVLTVQLPVSEVLL